MRSNVRVIALSGVLVVFVGFHLLRSVSDDGPATSVSQVEGAVASRAEAQQPTTSRATQQLVPQNPAIESFDSAASEGRNTEGPYNKDLKDPKGARKVINFIGQDLGSPSKKVEAIRSAIVESGSCIDEVCKTTKESMLARVEAAAAAAAQTRGSLTAKAVECYEVGCIVDVTASGGPPLQVVMDQLRHAGRLDWHAPAIYSKPTFSNGTQSSMWVLFNPAASSSR
jgi:hypothetical protein